MRLIKLCVIGCRFNHFLGERVLSMWRTLAAKYPVEVHILTTDRWIDKPGDSRLGNSKNLKIHKLLTVGAKYGQFKHAMPGLLYKLIELRPDFVYAQEEPIQMGVTWPAYLAAKFIKRPFVFFTWENKLQKWFFPIRSIENQMIKGSDLMIAGTKQSKEILIKKGANPKKVVVLPETGIDTKMFKPSRVKPEKTVLYVGRLVKEKGINVLLKARAHLIKKKKHYKYMFVGDGPLRSKLEKLAKKNKDIILPKPVPYAEVPKLYHKGNIFFYASLRTKKWEEQYGYSMLEALASGLPVISTKGISGPEAIVTDYRNGHLINEGNWKELVEVMEYMFDEPGVLESYSKRAREDAVKRLSKEAVAEKTYALLSAVHRGR